MVVVVVVVVGVVCIISTYSDISCSCCCCCCCGRFVEVGTLCPWHDWYMSSDAVFLYDNYDKMMSRLLNGMTGMQTM